MAPIPANLQLLHSGEELRRAESVAAIETDARMLLHVSVIECVMGILEVLRVYPTADEDLKLIQVLGMRQFNAFASASKLALSGYYQNSAMILRDILETAFLVDYFRSEALLSRNGGTPTAPPAGNNSVRPKSAKLWTSATGTRTAKGSSSTSCSPNLPVTPV